MELLSIPAITAIVQALKMEGMPSKISPLVSIILGLTLGFILTEGSVIERVIFGLVFGLSASGLYDNARPFIK